MPCETVCLIARLTWYRMICMLHSWKCIEKVIIRFPGEFAFLVRSCKVERLWDPLKWLCRSICRGIMTNEKLLSFGKERLYSYLHLRYPSKRLWSAQYYPALHGLAWLCFQPWHWVPAFPAEAHAKLVGPQLSHSQPSVSQLSIPAGQSTWHTNPIIICSKNTLL